MKVPKKWRLAPLVAVIAAAVVVAGQLGASGARRTRRDQDGP